MVLAPPRTSVSRRSGVERLTVGGAVRSTLPLWSSQRSSALAGPWVAVPVPVANQQACCMHMVLHVHMAVNGSGVRTFEARRVELGADGVQGVWSAGLTAITGQPVYQQIADDLRTKIADGVYAVGEALPSTAKLMEEYRGSITVVRAAIRALQTEGVVIGQPGKGVYVQRRPEPGTAAPDVSERLDQLTEAVRLLDERMQVLERAIRPPRR